MYETKKQIELANIAIKTFYWNQEKYDALANSLLFEVEEEKKTKLTNYIKILCMSSSVKNKEATTEFEIKKNSRRKARRTKAIREENGGRVKTMKRRIIEAITTTKTNPFISNSL